MSRKRKVPDEEPETPLKTHLFHFTTEELADMACAMDSARRFMKKYGRGRQPFMIDKSKYYN